MDKIAEQLRQDAERIEVSVSDALDRRIVASLHATETDARPVSDVKSQPSVFWWASTVTGIAATFAVVAFFNLGPSSDDGASPSDNGAVSAGLSPVPEIVSPTIDWKTDSAMLTSPLQQELDDLQADMKKAEARIKQEIGL